MDEVQEWTAAVGRVRELMAGVDDEQAARPVPSCPDWTVTQLLAHMVGLGADVVRGDEPDDHNSAWTQRQVDERRTASVGDLLAEWDTLLAPLQQWMREHTTRPLGDVVIHEQDLRGALGVPGGQDTDGLAAVRDRMVARFATRLATTEGLGPIALVGDRWTWVSSGAVDDADVVVRASDFELARAVISRRSADQLRGWTERGDIEPYLTVFEVLGPLPTGPLSES